MGRILGLRRSGRVRRRRGFSLEDVSTHVHDGRGARAGTFLLPPFSSLLPFYLIMIVLHGKREIEDTRYQRLSCAFL
jgi:hypothetical protein